MASAAAGDAAWAFAVVTCVKLLLSPAYRSTDFDVHRHWLALTHSLQADQWYLDTSSQWTLDYPPLFALFSLLVALPAPFLDPTIVSLTPGPTTQSHVIYLRLSAAAADLLLLFAVARLTGAARRRQRPLAAVLVLWSPALLIVDHIHFQYNGFLLGVFLLSLSFLEDGLDLAGGAAFAVLLCSKHLFLVASPVYFVYLLRHYCSGGTARAVLRFMTMGMVVGSVFAAAFGPFLYFGQMREVLSRLFPFGRGLCHAYWAPNFWVFYIILDKLLASVLMKLGFTIQAPTASFTGGLVGNESPFSVLPQVTPIVTFLLVILSMLPCLIKALSNPQPRHLIRWAAYACTCGFMFGWHVHEKASLHFTIPLAIIATDSLDDAKHYFLLSIGICL